MHKLSENLKVDVAMAQATLNNSSNTPTYFSMANYDSAIFYIFTGTLTGAASINATIWQSDGTTPAATTITRTAYTTDDGVFALEIRGENLSVNSGYYLIGILVTETATANAVVGSLLVRERARYAQATLPA